MRKWIGAICSILASALTLSFLRIRAFEINLGVIEQGKYSGWELLTNKKVSEWDFASVKWYRIFTWILIVLAILLIVLSILQILANLNVLKISIILTRIGKVSLIALVIISVFTLLANIGIRTEWIDFFKNPSSEALGKIKEALEVGFSLWIISIVNLIIMFCCVIFAKNKK